MANHNNSNTTHYLFVFEVDFLGGDATPAGLQLPGPLLQDAELLVSEGGRRRGGVLYSLHGVRALEGVVVHHLILSLWCNIRAD